ncbi:hypothetical protein LNAOJCKE_0408 [Methylorubrum aminovorans]|uniref:Uncharacterized protein n=1 Tax=Methylorubrum aminovorans TaxID=269069 RepID=A0ABQ4U8B5_9HYPH|nr:hypothetical protein [Methylorubrum aminovorans]GJE63214.1 hypothetical protein LNAOJCKE_0408 [Methylorubrum aminovorans]GMA79257.1 hypothetical protein GCM10025880_56740 [Methylorubrum aminovorans]
MSYIQYLSTPEEVLYDDPQGHFTVTRHLEFIQGEWRTFLHTEFFYFAPSVLREVRRIFPIERAKLPPTIYAILNHEKAVGPHYLKVFGFKPLADVPYDDGKIRTWWVHERSK